MHPKKIIVMSLRSVMSLFKKFKKSFLTRLFFENSGKVIFDYLYLANPFSIIIGKLLN